MSFHIKAAASSCAASVVLVVVAVLTPARAAEPTSFTIPAEDGYGIAECMQPGSECGRVMANSWCEAHGHVKAVAYGSADDVTGSVPHVATPVSAQTADVVIRCTD